MTFAEAIAQMENTNTGLNNPCALTAAPSRYCQSGKQGILVQFCSIDDGWGACNNQIQLNTDRGLNVNTFFGGNGSYPGFAPAAAGNDPVSYANSVAGWLGIDPTTSLATLDPEQLYYAGGSGGSGGIITGDAGIGSGITLDPVMIGIGLLGVVLLARMLG